MRQVTKDEFYRVIGPQNVHPQIQNSKWPYTSLWKLQGSYASANVVVGKTVDGVPEGKAFAITEYYLNS
jgi:hypothetical protein